MTFTCACSYDVVRFDVCYLTVNVTEFQCKQKGKHALNVNDAGYIVKSILYLIYVGPSAFL